MAKGYVGRLDVLFLPLCTWEDPIIIAAGDFYCHSCFMTTYKIFFHIPERLSLVSVSRMTSFLRSMYLRRIH